MSRTRISLVLATAALGAAVGYASTLFSPTLFASESVLAFIPQTVPVAYVRGAGSLDEATDQLGIFTSRILSRTRLERMIHDFSLYTEQRSEPMEALVHQMRDRVSIVPVEGNAFRVRFADTNAKRAMWVTERLTSLLVEENLRDRENSAENVNDFLDSQIDGAAKRLDEKDAELETLRTQGRRVPRSEQVQFEVLQETYRSLVLKAEDARLSTNLERRQIGMQIRIMDAARLPEKPIDRGGLKLGLISGAVGLVAGLGIAFRRPRA